MAKKLIRKNGAQRLYLATKSGVPSNAIKGVNSDGLEVFIQGPNTYLVKKRKRK